MEKSEHSVYVGKNKMSLGLLNGTAIWSWINALYAMFLGCLDFERHKMASSSFSRPAFLRVRSLIRVLFFFSWLDKTRKKDNNNMLLRSSGKRNPEKNDLRSSEFGRQMG